MTKPRVTDILWLLAMPFWLAFLAIAFVCIALWCLVFPQKD